MERTVIAAVFADSEALGGQEITVDGEEFMILRAEDIYAVVE